MVRDLRSARAWPSGWRRDSWRVETRGLCSCWKQWRCCRTPGAYVHVFSVVLFNVVVRSRAFANQKLYAAPIVQTWSVESNKHLWSECIYWPHLLHFLALCTNLWVVFFFFFSSVTATAHFRALGGGVSGLQAHALQRLRPRGRVAQVRRACGAFFFFKGL